MTSYPVGQTKIVHGELMFNGVAYQLEDQAAFDNFVFNTSADVGLVMEMLFGETIRQEYGMAVLGTASKKLSLASAEKEREHIMQWCCNAYVVAKVARVDMLNERAFIPVKYIAEKAGHAANTSETDATFHRTWLAQMRTPAMHRANLNFDLGLSEYQPLQRPKTHAKAVMVPILSSLPNVGNVSYDYIELARRAGGSDINFCGDEDAWTRVLSYCFLTLGPSTRLREKFQSCSPSSDEVGYREELNGIRYAIRAQRRKGVSCDDYSFRIATISN